MRPRRHGTRPPPEPRVGGVLALRRRWSVPLSEVAARDDFFNIKNVSRDDALAAHRIPPQLLGIVPSNTGGFGAVLPAAQVFARNEIKPLQERFREINDWLGEEVVRFVAYEVPSEAGGAVDGRKD
jgi:capsid portal protein